MYLRKKIIKQIAKKRFENFCKNLLNTPRYTTKYIEIENLKLKISDSPSFLFSYKEIFKQEVYYFQTKSSNPYIIDAGANIGLSSIYFKRLFPNSEITAFEADPKIADYLNYNLQANQIKDVKVINKALYKEDSLRLNFNSEGADAGSLSDNKHNNTAIEVETVRLSNFITKKVDYLKIDIEGAEFMVIEEIESKLHLIEKIFIEYHSFVGENQCLHHILSILSKNHFRYYLDTPGLRSQNPFKHLNTYLNMDLQVNIFAFKE